jgi:hypothetical protein
MLKKLAGIVFIFGGYLFYCFFLYVAAGYSATSHPDYYIKLGVLPLLCLFPLTASAFISDKKMKAALVGVSIIAAAWGLAKAKRGSGSEEEVRSTREELLANYRSAQNSVQEPARLFLTCLAARGLVYVKCEDYLRGITNGEFCKDICKKVKSGPAHPDCSHPSESKILDLVCAQELVRNINPKAPVDVCKAAGFSTESKSESSFEGEYYRCLRTDVIVGKKKGTDGKDEYEHKTLGDLLKIPTRGIPRTKNSPALPFRRVLQIEKEEEPMLDIYEFANSDDVPYIKLINPTSFEDFPKVEIIVGRGNTSILKIENLKIRPGEIKKISLAKQIKLLRELGWPEDKFFDLGVRPEVRVGGFSLASRFSSEMGLCLKSWNLDPFSKKKLFIELVNFSNQVKYAGGLTFEAYGRFVSDIKTDKNLKPHQSIKIELEDLRGELKSHFENSRPEAVFYKTLRVFGRSLVALTQDIEKQLDFCVSPKE